MKYRLPVPEFLTSWNAQKFVTALGAVVALALAWFLASAPADSGDYGQWLMVSRSYQGADVPAYRDGTSVPPLMPAALAVVSWVSPDPYFALQLFKGLLGAAFAGAIFLAGSSIYRHRGAGILAVVVAFLVTDRLLEPFAFGGLPQLLSLTFMTLAVAAFANAANQQEPHLWWWVAGSVMLTASGFAHLGTGLLAVLGCGAFAGVSALRRGEWGWRERALVLTPVIASGLVLAAYYQVVLLPLNETYASNPASLAYRGPYRIVALVRSYFPNVLVLIAGLVSLVWGITDSARPRLQNAHLAVAAWLATTWGFLALSVATGSATDYPRFLSPMFLPLAIAAAGGITRASVALIAFLRDEYQRAGFFIAPAAVAVVIAIAIGATTVPRHLEESRGYLMTDRASLLEAVSWIDRTLPAGKAVLSPTREGKWVEGLTGREALFDIPVRFSFRPAERDRSVAAETLVRSTTSLVNEYMFVKFVESKTVSGTEVPRHPWFAINHGGEYVDLVRLSPTATRLVAADNAGGTLATLNSLAAVDATYEEGDDRIAVLTRWQGERSGLAISYSRSVTMERGQAYVDLVDSVQTDLPVAGLEVEIATIPGVTLADVRQLPDGVELVFPPLAGMSPRLVIDPLDSGIEFRPSAGGVVAVSPAGKAMRLRFRAVEPGTPIYHLALLRPDRLIDQYGVGAVLLEQGPALESRLDRLGRLGFVPAYAAIPYVVLTRQGLPASPSAAEDTQTAPGASPNPLSIAAMPATPMTAAEFTPLPAAMATPVPKPPAGLEDAAAWIASQSGTGTLLATTAEDAGWLTRLTGLPSVYARPINAEMTTAQLREASGIEALLRSSLGVVSPRFFVKFVESKTTASGDVSRHPWIGISHGGTYVDLLRVPPTTSRIRAGDAQSTVLATLGTLAPVGMTTEAAPNRIVVESTWAGARPAGEVRYTQTTTVAADGPSLEMVDIASGAPSIGAIEVEVWPAPGVAPRAVDIGEGHARFTFAIAGADDAVIRVESVNAEVIVTKTEGGVQFRSVNGAVVHLRFTIETSSAPIVSLGLLRPSEIVESQGLTKVIVPAGPGSSTRIDRLRGLGFRKAFENERYVVLALGEP